MPNVPLNTKDVILGPNLITDWRSAALWLGQD